MRPSGARKSPFRAHSTSWSRPERDETHDRWTLSVAEFEAFVLALERLAEIRGGRLPGGFPVGRRWVKGGSKPALRENRRFPVRIDATYDQGGDSKDCQCSSRNTLRTVRGGSCREPSGRKGEGRPAASNAAGRHCRIPGEGAGVGEMGVPTPDGGSRLTQISQNAPTPANVRKPPPAPSESGSIIGLCSGLESPRPQLG